ncbi:ankyrin repeat domain-containing protein [Flavobacterium sp. LS1R49]|uniref:Ankyrin repeat domain-containing protein n=1 Tax=Flavobacterium shii TaxID=2987687 RepID=A0A9X3C4I0_9FLAO|nr:ankyrin repeat domain-containing protein [Flavobacterium shii]MCV9927809.1 ankyrin repeat domain-containing protein [Flavobacterium shii]
MKKSIVYLGVALVAFANVTLASSLDYKSFINDKHLNYEVSPLNDAICKGDIETVKQLIESGANVNKFSGGLTPLMTAARYNKVEIIKLLISSGAKLRIEAENGYTALTYAEVSKAKDAEALLKTLLKK